ncbi:MAG: ABC transporter permease [Candidatus Blackburnbacteria bacterium]|nr:ABC transporter permease [Candidatus Blackburnbacteria bacterium]
MDIRETVNSAATAILANRLRSFLTILGIVIGVTSVILLTSLVSGLRTFIISQIQGLGSNLIFVIPGRIGGARSPGGVQANRLTLADAANLKIKLAPNAEVSAVIQRSATLKYTNKLDKGASVFGVQANYPKLISIEIKQGRFFTTSEAESGKRVAVVGTSVVDILFGSQPALGKTTDIAGLKYQIVGIAAKRGSILGIDQDNSALIPLSSAQKQFGIDRLNTIYISANRPEGVKSVQEKATVILKKRLSEDEFSVLTQEQTLSTVSQITRVLTLALGGIAAISLVVGGVGVMNIMLVSVTERTREIGLRKALGARPADIRNQFLIEAITLSGLGGAIGIFLGIIFSFIVGQFIQTSITWWSVVLSFGVSTLVGIIFGVAPALRASRLDPIEALRYE